MSIVTLATDFGTADGYVAAVKGVIKSISPNAEIIDVTHDLESIAKAGLVLTSYYSHYPPDTIHLVIVDPTVGSSRKALIGHYGWYYLVGPDNGLFSRIALQSKSLNWWAIDQTKLPTREISHTFHGRDIIAPAAAFLANGISPDKLGTRIDSPVLIKIPMPIVHGDIIEGEIIDIDKFGNLITNIGSEVIKGAMKIVLESDTRISLVRTYSDVPAGEPLAYIGSLGYLEIAVNLGRADRYFDAGIGRKVRVTL